MATHHEFEISLTDLDYYEFSAYELVDVRESVEKMLEPLKGRDALAWPMSSSEQNRLDLDEKKKYLIFCAHGMRSRYLAEQLRLQGHANVFSLTEGILSLNEYISRHASSPTEPSGA